MKKLFSVLAASLIVIIFATSCSKSHDGLTTLAVSEKPTAAVAANDQKKPACEAPVIVGKIRNPDIAGNGSTRIHYELPYTYGTVNGGGSFKITVGIKGGGNQSFSNPAIYSDFNDLQTTVIEFDVPTRTNNPSGEFTVTAAPLSGCPGSANPAPTKWTGHVGLAD